MNIGRRTLLRVGAGAALGVAVVGGVTSPAAAAAARSWWPASGPRFDTSMAAAVVAASRRSIGRWQAGDVPHLFPVAEGEALWLLNDSFLSDRPDGPIDGGSAFVRNVAIRQTGGSLALDADQALLDTGDRYDRWWWFHGGVVDGSLLHVVTTEMLRTGALGWAINFEPVRTWIATIAWRTGAVLRHRPAPDDGVTPVYGFSVATLGDWTYLFGNNHLYGRGTTENRVARVPAGQLLDRPSYWDGERWGNDPARAVSVHTHGDWACRLHVVCRDGAWWAASKDEEFFGDRVTVWRADAPTGPWSPAAVVEVPTATGDDRSCTYDAMLHPLDDGSLLLWWSNNAFDEADVRADPSIYRPTFRIVPPQGLEP